MLLPKGKGVRLAHANVWVSDALLDRLEYVCEFFDLENATIENQCTDIDIVVDYQVGQGLHLIWNIEGQKKPLQYHIDYYKQIAGIRSFPAPKQTALNQALGKKTKRVVDATGGWGSDAILLATQGYDVAIFERNPLMALLIYEALSRFQLDVDKRSLPITVPSLTLCSSTQGVEQINGPIDCVYLDPMFPPKRKKSAAANKNMQLLQWLVGTDSDASQMLSAFLKLGVKRVTVKRPDYAAPLLDPPTQQFFSKLVHYDVYLSN